MKGRFCFDHTKPNDKQRSTALPSSTETAPSTASTSVSVKVIGKRKASEPGQNAENPYQRVRISYRRHTPSERGGSSGDSSDHTDHTDHGAAVDLRQALALEEEAVIKLPANFRAAERTEAPEVSTGSANALTTLALHSRQAAASLTQRHSDHAVQQEGQGSCPLLQRRARVMQLSQGTVLPPSTEVILLPSAEMVALLTGSPALFPTLAGNWDAPSHTPDAHSVSVTTVSVRVPIVDRAAMNATAGTAVEARCHVYWSCDDASLASVSTTAGAGLSSDPVRAVAGAERSRVSHAESPLVLPSKNGERRGTGAESTGLQRRPVLAARAFRPSGGHKGLHSGSGNSVIMLPGSGIATKAEGVALVTRGCDATVTSGNDQPAPSFDASAAEGGTTIILLPDACEQGEGSPRHPSEPTAGMSWGEATPTGNTAATATAVNDPKHEAAVPRKHSRRGELKTRYTDAERALIHEAFITARATKQTLASAAAALAAQLGRSIGAITGQFELERQRARILRSLAAQEAVTAAVELPAIDRQPPEEARLSIDEKEGEPGPVSHRRRSIADPYTDEELAVVYDAYQSVAAGGEGRTQAARRVSAQIGMNVGSVLKRFKLLASCQGDSRS